MAQIFVASIVLFLTRILGEGQKEMHQFPVSVSLQGKAEHYVQSKVNLIHIACNRLTIDYLVQQIAQSIINNNNLSHLPFLLLSTFTGRYTEKHTNTSSSV
jgi:hypothetical protein